MPKSRATSRAHLGITVKQYQQHYTERDPGPSPRFVSASQPKMLQRITKSTELAIFSGKTKEV